MNPTDMILWWAGMGEVGKSSSPTSVPSSLPETPPASSGSRAEFTGFFYTDCLLPVPLGTTLTNCDCLQGVLTHINLFELDRAGVILGPSL